MSLKLKALGLSAFTMMTFSASVGTDASAETGGHFTTNSPSGYAWLTATESGTHKTELTVPGLTGIVCDEAKYEATVAGTSEAVDVTPRYANCKTTGGTAGELAVDMNGCQYRFTIGKKSTADNTVDLTCPAGNQVVVTHPNCEIKIPPQNGILGVAYNTVVESEVHWLTVAPTARHFTTHFESGFCVLLGTKKESELTGSTTVGAWEDKFGLEIANHQVSITATGSEG